MEIMCYVNMVTMVSHSLYKDYEEAFVQLDPMMWYPSLVTLLTGDHEQVNCSSVEINIVYCCVCVCMCMCV